jgi:hypothetical protein
VVVVGINHLIKKARGLFLSSSGAGFFVVLIFEQYPPIRKGFSLLPAWMSDYRSRPPAGERLLFFFPVSEFFRPAAGGSVYGGSVYPSPAVSVIIMGFLW